MNIQHFLTWALTVKFLFGAPLAVDLVAALIWSVILAVLIAPPWLLIRRRARCREAQALARLAAFSLAEPPGAGEWSVWPPRILPPR